MTAMDSIGWGENERRASGSRISELKDALPPPPPPPPPKPHFPLKLSDITIYDLTDWIDRFSNIQGQGHLADSGQFGLDFVTGQADQLFWVIGPALAYTKQGGLNLNAMHIIAQVFTHERVSWALDDLLTQLDALADQA